MKITAFIDAETGQDEQGRVETKTRVEEALGAAGVQATVELISVDLSGQLRITLEQDSESVEDVLETVGQCKGVEDAKEEDEEEVFVQAAIDTTPGVE